MRLEGKLTFYLVLLILSSFFFSRKRTSLQNFRVKHFMWFDLFLPPYICENSEVCSLQTKSFIFLLFVKDDMHTTMMLLLHNIFWEKILRISFLSSKDFFILACTPMSVIGSLCIFVKGIPAVSEARRTRPSSPKPKKDVRLERWVKEARRSQEIFKIQTHCLGWIIWKKCLASPPVLKKRPQNINVYVMLPSLSLSLSCLSLFFLSFFQQTLLHSMPLFDGREWNLCKRRRNCVCIFSEKESSRKTGSKKYVIFVTRLFFTFQVVSVTYTRSVILWWCSSFLPNKEVTRDWKIQYSKQWFFFQVLPLEVSSWFSLGILSSTFDSQYQTYFNFHRVSWEPL